jgi:hypothetical protein
LNSPDCHRDWDENPQHHNHDRPKHQAGYVRVENFPKLHLLTSLLIGSPPLMIEREGSSAGSDVGIVVRRDARDAPFRRSREP